MRNTVGINKRFAYFIVILLFVPVQITHGEGLPILDGIISEGEWDGSFEKIIRMNNGIDITLKAIYTETDVYYLVTFPHNSPGDEIERDPAAGRHDYFGIEFDNNKDGTIMGTTDSPDDMVLIDYDVPGAVDMFSHSFLVFKDLNNEGENNVEGKSNEDDGTLIYEFRKSLNTIDVNGYDIILKEGDSYFIMPAIWDNKNIHSAAGAINKQIGNSIFLELTVGEPASLLIEEFISVIAIVLASGVVLALFFIKK
ncbi:MAG: hypothetical protein GPJ54_22335 [Candidatus Heimdallarchaeota archaeon]|nr:hypothetical protein [Candidatus Heimdallarchaeota archaeon]